MTELNKMKAIVIREYGDETKLTETQLDIPKINEDQVLVKVKRIGVNPIDWKTRQGLRQERYPFDFPIVLGQEMSGIVQKVGENVTDFKVGDAVIGYGTPSNRGTYAEYVAINQDQIAHKAANVPFSAAAGLALTGTTAWQALFDAGHLKAGQTVLILAGSGGVGSIAIQLAKSIGAHVITTTSAKNTDYVNALGADEVIDYHRTPFSEKLTNIDLVFDTLGGDNQREAFQVVKPGGRIISIVETTPQADELSRQTKVSFNKINAHPDQKVITTLANMLADQQLTVKIADEKPFTVQNVQALHQESETGHVVGKLILDVD